MHQSWRTIPLICAMAGLAAAPAAAQKSQPPKEDLYKPSVQALLNPTAAQIPADILPLDLPPGPRGTCAACPPGGAVEVEPDCGVPTDTVNGGCNSTPNVFGTIALGGTVCGTSVRTATLRDTDWYEFTLAATTDVAWTVQAEFLVQINLVNGLCPPTSLGFALGAACTPTSLTVTLAPGTYRAFVAHQFASPVNACADDLRYFGRLTQILGACCTDGGCLVMQPSDCAAAGGTFLGDGTSCPPPAYAAKGCDGAFEDISASGTAGCVGDDCSTLVPMGFSFSFFGNTYTDIRVGSNGYMTFGAVGSDFTNDPIPNTALPNDIICPLWDDWRTDNAPGSPTGCIGVAPQLDTQTLGVAPYRRFVAQWTSVCAFGDSGGPRSTFQAVLYETTNRIVFRYNTWSNNSPTIGVENISGTAGTALAPGGIALVACRSFAFDPNPLGPCFCGCDFNMDGIINSQDFFDFLGCFFGGCP